MSFEKKDNLKWLDDNIEFHLYLAELSKNGMLFQIIKNLNMRVHKYKYILLMKPELIEQYVSHHEEIINHAIVNKNPKKAGKTMERHINAIKKNLIKYLKTVPFY